MIPVKKILNPKLLVLPVLLVLGQFAPGILTAIYNQITGSKLQSADEMGATIWAKIWYLATTYPFQLQSADEMGTRIWAKIWHLTAAYPFLYPHRVLWSTALLMVLVVLYSHGLPFIKRMWQRRIILEKIGIRAYIKRDTIDSRKDSWNDCAEHVTKSPFIYMALANGWETFGDANSPLHGALRNFSGDVKVILLHPESTHADTRSASARENRANYKINTKKSTQVCRKLKSENKSISLALYDWYPVWKMIISNDMLWLQHYEDGKPVDTTPVYSFSRTPTPGSLYHPFLSDFLRMWDRAEKLDLSLSEKKINTHLKREPSSKCDSCPGAEARN